MLYSVNEVTAMTSIQMNTRIDAGLKASGDLAIRESGHKPSEIVRAVWGYAARNRHKPKAMAALLDFLSGTAPTTGAAKEEAPIDNVVEQVMKGPRLIDAFCKSRGIDPRELEPTTYENLKDAAIDDKVSGLIA